MVFESDGLIYKLGVLPFYSMVDNFTLWNLLFSFC